MNALEKSRALIDRDLVSGAKTWNLSGNSSRSDSKTSLHSLGVSKDFEWGGRLQLNHSLSDSPYSASNSQQSLTFSQNLGRNLFGRQFYTSLEIANERVRLSEIILSQKKTKLS